MSFLCTTINKEVSYHKCVNECKYLFKIACIDKMNEAYNQALEDFSKKMKEVNLTNSFVLYYGDEIDLEEFMILASDEIKEQLMK